MTAKATTQEKEAYMRELQAAQDAAQKLWDKLAQLSFPNLPYMGTMVSLRRAARYKCMGIQHNLDSLRLQEG